MAGTVGGGGAGGGSGDMQVAVYDADGDHIVDDAEKLGGKGAASFMDVLIYDPRGITDDAFNLANLTGNLDGGVFT